MLMFMSSKNLVQDIFRMLKQFDQRQNVRVKILYFNLILTIQHQEIHSSCLSGR